MVLCREGVPLLQLRAAGGMALAMADTEVLTHEGAETVWEVAAEDLFRGVWRRQYRSSHARDLRECEGSAGHTVQLMPVEMLSAGVALAAAFLGTFEFAIGGRATTAPTALGGLFFELGHFVWFSGEHHWVP